MLMVRKHQMIRRGRAFGRPVSATLDPQEMIAAHGKPDPERRGLHFMCLVANISRQFELVQRAWIHSANFAALCKDGDPITAARRPRDHENANDEFTCPATPVRRKYTQLPQFTRLVGGAYFFLPGIAALRFISRHP
jgi:deferrochelatase/peroxidase EfeB